MRGQCIAPTLSLHCGDSASVPAGVERWTVTWPFADGVRFCRSEQSHRSVSQGNRVRGPGACGDDAGTIYGQRFASNLSRGRDETLPRRTVLRVDAVNHCGLRCTALQRDSTCCVDSICTVGRSQHRLVIGISTKLTITGVSAPPAQSLISSRHCQYCDFTRFLGSSHA